MSRVWAEIDCQKWVANYRALAAAAEPAMVLPVLKSDGYGLGAVAVAETFQRLGVKRVAVATVGEARELQNPGLEIQFLGVPEPQEIPAIVEMNGIGSVADVETARRFSVAAENAGAQARIHVLVDTGMGRLGLLEDEVVEKVCEIAALPNLEVEGIYSHFPLAEEPDEQALEQIALMRQIVEEVRDRGVTVRYVHMANSYAVSSLRQSRSGIFNMVRPGIELHGAGDALGNNRRLPVQPVMTLKAKLLAVRELPSGFTVGYGRTYTLQKPERIGTVAIGYADGYPRSLSNRGEVLINGRRCPVVGSVCMDYIQVALDDIPDVKPGAEVVLIGRQGKEEITVQEVARAAGTITYEILTHLGARIERRYLPARV
ncbi:MAG: alanine racemase [Lentisphaeria bacterium]